MNKYKHKTKSIYTYYNEYRIYTSYPDVSE